MGVRNVSAGQAFAPEWAGEVGQLGPAGHTKMFWVRIYNCLLVFSTLFSVQRKSTELLEVEGPMSRHIHSLFRLTQFMCTLFTCILDANNKGFIGPTLGGRTSWGHPFVRSCNLIGSQMDDLRFFIIFG